MRGSLSPEPFRIRVIEPVKRTTRAYPGRDRTLLMKFEQADRL